MTDAWIEKCITEISDYTRTHLSRFRYEHSVRVAIFAEELAQHYGYSRRLQRLCYLAGISHDACKEIPIASLLRIVQRDGQRVSEEERNNTELLHGRAAAVFLQTRYGIHKKSLLRAVRCHTSASAKFDTVGKILYIADKIEPGRKNCDALREKAAALSLDALFYEVITEVIAFVKKKGQSVQSCTYKTASRMKQNTELMRRRPR